jgi:hypothetical protein
MQGLPKFKVHFSKSSVAASLWDYGEDELADRAIQMTDTELVRIQALASHYEDPAYPLPMSGQRITHNHVRAFAAITFYEGRVRPLRRTRRRPQAQRPARYTPLPPDPATGL